MSVDETWRATERLPETWSLISLPPSLNAMMMIGTRILFAMGRDGLVWSRTATVNAGGTPSVATLVTTADHDDRVVPAHSFKYAATLQKAASTDNPVLIRIDTKSGHGASSLTKALETTADIYAFIMHNMGITPRAGTN